VRRAGDLLFCAGHPPYAEDGSLITGVVPDDLDVEAARKAARRVGLGLLATLRAELGSLDRVRTVVKLLGMVNSAPGFTQQSDVINGCSELFVEVFGAEIGRHARSAVGMNGLPVGLAVEIEAIVQFNGEE